MYWGVSLGEAHLNLCRLVPFCFLKNFYRLLDSFACPVHTGLNCPLKPNQVFSLPAVKLTASVRRVNLGLCSEVHGSSSSWKQGSKDRDGLECAPCFCVVYILITFLLEALDGWHLAKKFCCSVEVFQVAPKLPPPERLRRVLRPH